ncbi:hypothetical protein AB0C77_31660 [Streptomyces sp. NPDC048629]|uniref:hypothetical protein n=1 Tax=Streptomyces sp. NPDC048629 TaxID=3154824 RepID=UPI0034173CC6
MVTYIAPLYAVAELGGVMRGETWWDVALHLQRMDQKLTAAETRCNRAGDYGFTERVTRVIDRLTITVDHVVDRLARI